MRVELSFPIRILGNARTDSPAHRQVNKQVNKTSGPCTGLKVGGTNTSGGLTKDRAFFSVEALLEKEVLKHHASCLACWLALLSVLAWAAACRTEPVGEAPPLRIAALGKSITSGERPSVADEHLFTAILQEVLHDAGLEGATVTNHGIPSEQTSGGLVHLVRDVLSTTQDYVIIMGGTDDSFLDPGDGAARLAPELYADNLRVLIDICREAGAVPVLVTPPPLGMKYKARVYEPYASREVNFSLREYVEACRRAARRPGALLVDLFAEWEAAQSRGMDIDRWKTDGRHPNPEGQGLIAKSLWSVLSEEIPEIPDVDAIQAPGYTIPTIDLADQEFRQVIVDREPGQYLGHPTTVLLEDGRTMIAVYPKGHGRGAVVMKRSPDAGLTWSERLPTPENWKTSQEVPTLHRVIDAQGVSRLIMFSGLYPIRLAVSEDDGRSWSPLRPIGDFGGIVAMGCVERLRNGDYMAMFHDDGRFIREGGERAGVFTLYKTISGDGGLTWSRPVEILRGRNVHLCEPGVFRSPDGKQLAVMLRENSRTRNSYVIFSDDEGTSWTEPRELPASLTGDRHTGCYAPDGRLLISFRDRTHDSPTWGDWVAWVGSYEDIVLGREGQYRVRLMDNTQSADCAYPGVEILPDGTFVMTTYGHWIEGQQPFIVSVRLRLEELDRMAENGLVMAQEKRSRSH